MIFFRNFVISFQWRIQEIVYGGVHVLNDKKLNLVGKIQSL